jgi:calcineurin-like phosphoesterase family protein
MPIQLASISRREFLKRSLIAGAGLMLSHSLLAAARRTDANSWALLADTHIAADRARVARGINMTEHFKIVSKELLELPQRPAGVLVLGDCAFNSGEKGDYATMTELLSPLQAGKLPLHLALGNHDQRENFWEALRERKAARRPVVDKHVAMISTTHVNWFVLDSLETTLQTPGLLGQAQFDWLAKTLDSNRRKPAVILVHHNPGTEENITGLKDTQALYELIRPRKQVKAWIFGHTHNWKIVEDTSGIHLVNLPPVAYVFREGNPSGWVHSTTRRDGMRLELRCVDPKHKDHGQIVDLKWRAA